MTILIIKSSTFRITIIYSIILISTFINYFFTTVNCCWNSISTKIIPSIYLITIFYTSIFIFINVCIFIFKLFRRTFYLFLLWFCSSRSSCFFLPLLVYYHCLSNFRLYYYSYYLYYFLNQ